MPYAVCCMLYAEVSVDTAVCCMPNHWTSAAARPLAHLPTRPLAHTPAPRPVTQPITHATTPRHAPIRAPNLHVAPWIPCAKRRWHTQGACRPRVARFLCRRMRQSIRSARSVAASYKPPMLVTRARLPACALFLCQQLPASLYRRRAQAEVRVHICCPMGFSRTGSAV